MQVVGGEDRRLSAAPAALPAKAVSMVSELSSAAALGGDPGNELLHWRYDLRSGVRIRPGSRWNSNPWDLSDSDDLGGESRSRIGVGSRAWDQIDTTGERRSFEEKIDAIISSAEERMTHRLDEMIGWSERRN